MLLGKGGIQMRVLSALMLCVGLVACATNDYQQFYKPYADAKTLSDVRLLGQGESPTVYSSTDLKRDVKILRSKGFVSIGYSAFNGAIGSEDQLIDQARDVGALVVLVNSNYTDTQTTTVPLFLPNISTTYSSGSVYGSGGYAGYSGSSTTYGNTVVPLTSQQQRYDQTAIYFIKSTHKLKFGIYVVDLAPEIRTALERNTGALVDVVVENSPAFVANILPGDILIELDSSQVRNAEHALDLMKLATPTSGTCILKILRNGAEKNVTVQLDQ